MRNWLLGVLFLTGAVVAPPSPVVAQTLFSVSREDSSLRVVDPQTGVTLSSHTLLGAPATPILGAWGLADDPLTTSRLWVLWDPLEEGGDPTKRRLGVVEVASCRATECTIEDRGSVDERLVGLAASCEGDLWGITGDEAVPIVESLYRNLEACTAAACSPSLVLEASAGDFGEAIAFFGGQLFHAAGSSQQVFERIDTSTNQIFDIGIDPGGPSTSFDVASAMTAWPAQATLLLSGSNKLFRLSTAGVLSQVGTGTLDHFVNGLAFLDATCPSTTLIVDGFESGSTSAWSNSED